MKGWVYVLTNESMPGFVKVGSTDKDAVDRPKEFLRQTGVPHDYVLEHDLHIEEYKEVEQKTHKLLDSKRAEKKEWFKCSSKEAIDAIKKSSNIGWVYVITNEALPGLVKVGYAKNDPEDRTREFEKPPGAPQDYMVEYQAFVKKHQEVEQKTHKLLDSKREKKEWFRCSPEEAIDAIKEIAGNDLIREIYNGADRKKAERISAQKKLDDEEREKQELRKIEALRKQKLREAERISAQKKLDDEEREKQELRKIEALRKQKLRESAELLKWEKAKNVIEKDFSKRKDEIKNKYQDEFERRFPSKPFWNYWLGSSIIILICIETIISKTATDTKSFLVVILGGVLGIYIQEYFEKRQKETAGYTSLVKEQNEELSNVKDKITLCYKCGEKIDFDLFKSLFSRLTETLHCPSCRTRIYPQPPLVQSYQSPGINKFNQLTNQKIALASPNASYDKSSPLMPWVWAAVGFFIILLFFNLGDSSSNKNSEESSKVTTLKPSNYTPPKRIINKPKNNSFRETSIVEKNILYEPLLFDYNSSSDREKHNQTDATTTRATSNNRVTPEFRANRKKIELTREIQRLLKQMSYDPGLIDGIYGRRTINAILAFELDIKAPQLGLISKEIRDQLLLQRSILADKSRKQMYQKPESKSYFTNESLHIPIEKQTVTPQNIQLKNYFTHGSTKEDVLRIQGEPSDKKLISAYREKWLYSRGSVTFSIPSQKVISWNDNFGLHAKRTINWLDVERITGMWAKTVEQIAANQGCILNGRSHLNAAQQQKEFYYVYCTNQKTVILSCESGHCKSYN